MNRWFLTLVVLLVALLALGSAQVDIDKAKKLAKYSSVAYCGEKKVANWDCNYCKDDLKTFTFVKWIEGAFDTSGYFGYDDTTKEILVVFQGSASIANWVANLQFYKLDYDYPGVTGARVHSGFYKSSEELYQDLQAELRAIIAQKPGYKIVVTGHSQGGANGAMVALMIRDELGIEPEVQTFGEPRIGNVEYADYWKSRVNETIYRFTHKRDPVPQLPPNWVSFHHHPYEVFLQDGDGDEYEVCDWSGEDPDCHNSIWLPINVFDHLWYLGIYLGIPCF